jgi:stage II sporulation protein AA (anti-sigma F factor antagonist)
MSEQMKREGGRLTVWLPKEVDHHAAARIREEADRYLESGSVSELFFDFRETEFMDSSGIGMLMGRYRMMHLMGGRVAACNLHRNVYRIIQMAGLEKIIEIL